MVKETWYDEEEDILNIQLSKGEYWKSIELSNGIVLDISKAGKLMALEIPRAKKIFAGDVRKVLQMATA